MRRNSSLSSQPLRALLVVALLVGLLPVAALAAPAVRSFAQETPAADGPEIFVSDVLPAVSSQGRLLTLILGPAGDATLSTNTLNGEDPLVEIGTWGVDDTEGAILVRLSGTDTTDYETPVEFVFAREEDGSLTAVEWDETAYGTEALVLQPARNTEVAGVWASEALPAASSPEREVLLLLDYDGTASLSMDSLDGEGPTVELGTWDAEAGEVTVSLTGQPDAVYEAPIEWVFALGTETLTATAWDETIYGSEELTLGRAAAEVVELGSPDGVWVSEILPASSTPGQVVLLILYPDNSLQSSTWYLNKELPVIENGSWTDNDDGTVTITVTGSTEQEYASPQELVFDFDGASLQYLSLTLTRLAEQRTASTAEPVAFFLSGVEDAASGPALQRSLILFEDGSAQMVTDYQTGEAPITEVGTWEQDGAGNLLLELTGRPDADYNTPIAITFVQEMTTLSSTEWDETLYGAEGLSFEEQSLDDLLLEEAEALTGEATEDSTTTLTTTVETVQTVETVTVTVPATVPLTVTAPVASDDLLAAAAPFETPAGAQAVFVSDVLASASSPGRLIRLVLFEDGTLQLVTDTLDGETPILEVGTWEESAAGEILVAISGQFLSTPYDEPVLLTFAQAGETLTAVEWDEALYGSEPLTLTLETGE